MTPRRIIQGFLDGLTDMEPSGPVVTADLLQAAREYVASPDAPPALPEPELGEGGAPGKVTGEGEDDYAPIPQPPLEQVFAPNWPEGLVAGEFHRVPCDDKGAGGGCWLQVLVSPHDGDVYVSMQDWERMPEGKPNPIPSLRNRTAFGGGRNQRTHQALLWLARAIQLDAEEAKARGGWS